MLHFLKATSIEFFSASFRMINTLDYFSLVLMVGGGSGGKEWLLSNYAIQTHHHYYYQDEWTHYN